MKLTRQPARAGGVASLGRQDPNVYQGVGEAQERAGQQVAQGLASLSKGFDDMRDAVAQRQGEVEAAKIKKFENETMELMNSRDFYAYSELSEEAKKIIGKRESTDEIGTHEFAPQMYAEKLKKQIEDGAARIDDEVARDKWLRSMNSVAEDRINAVNMKALEASKLQIQEARVADFQEAIQSNDLDMAQMYVDSMAVTPAVRKKFQHEIDVKEEEVPYDDAISERNLESLEESLEKLQDPDYYEKGGKLGEHERISHIGTMTAMVDKINNESAAQLDIDVSMWKLRKRTMLSNDKDFLFADPGTYQQMYEEGMLLLEMDEIKPADLYEIELAYNKSQVGKSMIGMDPTDRKQNADTLRAKAQGGADIFDIELMSTMSDLNDTMTKLEQDDPIQAGIDYDRFRGSELPTLDPREGDFFNNLAVRFPWSKKVVAYQKSKPAFLTKSEAKLMTEHVDSLSDKQKMQFFGETAYVAMENGATPEDVQILFGQMVAESGNVSAIAGVQYVEQGEFAARTLLKGQQWLDDNPGVGKDLADQQTYLNIKQGLGQAYHGAGPIVQKAMEDATLAALVGMSIKEGQETFDILNMDDGYSAIDEAVKIATGGIVEHGRFKLQAPPRKYWKTADPQDDWDDWIDNLTGADLTGYVDHSDAMPSSEVAAKIRSGDYRLRWVGENMYRVDVQNPLQDEPVADPSGNAIVIEFGKNAVRSGDYNIDSTDFAKEPVTFDAFMKMQGM